MNVISSMKLFLLLTLPVPRKSWTSFCLPIKIDKDMILLFSMADLKMAIVLLLHTQCKGKHDVEAISLLKTGT